MRKLAVGCVVAVAVAALAAYWFAWRDPTGSAPSPYAEVPKPTEAQLDRLGTTLSSANPRTFSKALNGQVAAALRAEGQRALPRGATVSIDGSTLTAMERSASVKATVEVPGQAKTTWALLLTFERGRWVLFGTERIR